MKLSVICQASTIQVITRKMITQIFFFNLQEHESVNNKNCKADLIKKMYKKNLQNHTNQGFKLPIGLYKSQNQYKMKLVENLA